LRSKNHPETKGRTLPRDLVVDQGRTPQEEMRERKENTRPKAARISKTKLELLMHFTKKKLDIT